MKKFNLLWIFAIALIVLPSVNADTDAGICEVSNTSTLTRNWTSCSNITFANWNTVDYVGIESNFSGRKENVTIGGRPALVIFDPINATIGGTDEFIRNWGYTGLNGSKISTKGTPVGNISSSWDSNKGFAFYGYSRSGTGRMMFGIDGTDTSPQRVLPKSNYVVEAKVRANVGITDAAVIGHANGDGGAGDRSWGLFSSKDTGGGEKATFKAGFGGGNPDTNPCVGTNIGGHGWMTLAGGYDGSNIYLWQNGTQMCSVAKSGTPNTPNSELTLGAEYVNAFAQHQGEIGYARLWNYSKPPRELNLSQNMRFGYDSTIGKTFWNMTDIASGIYTYRFWSNDTSGVVTYSDPIVVCIGQTCPADAPAADVTPPTVSNAGFNLTTIKKNNMLNVSFNLTDGTALSTANITANFSTGKQFINYTVSGTSASIWHNFSIDCVRGCVINFTGYATDSSNNVGQTNTLVTIANTAPTCTAGTINNTSPKTNDVINQTGCIYSDADGDAQGTSLFKWFLNLVEIAGQTLKTLNLATGGNGNKGQTINASEAPYDGFDYGNYVNVSTFATVQDTTQTFTLANNNTSPKINEVVQLSSLTTDADTISTVIASWNGSASGLWINISNYTNPVTSFNYSVNVSVGRARGNTIGWLFYSNDSASNVYTVSSLNTFIVANTLPTTSSIGNGSDNNFNRNITLGATASTDADSDTLYYALYFEAINSPTVLVQNTTSTTFTTNMTNQTVYFAKVDVMDGFGKSSGTVIFNLTLDTSTPSWQSSLISNGTFYRTSQNITYNCTDSNIFEINTTVYNRAGTVQQRSIGYLNLTPSSGGSKTINLTIDTSLPDGEYNATRWCGDTKNKDLPIDYVTKAYSDGTSTFTDTKTGIQINITDGVLFKDVFLKVGEKDTTFVKTTTITDYLNSKGEVDSYYINAEYTLPKLADLQLGIDSTISYDTLVFANQIKSNVPITQSFDGLGTHLIFGSGKNKLSYDTSDLMSTYDTTLVQIGSTYYVTQSIKTDKKSKMKEGTVISIGESSKIETTEEKVAK